MKIVFIRSNDYDVTPAIPRALEAGKGIFTEVRILCWNRNNSRLPSKSYIDGIEIKRFIKIAPARSIRKVWVTFLYQCWVFWNLVRIRCDVVQVCGLKSGVPAGLACLLTRKKFVYDMRDPFALCYKFSNPMRRLVYAVDWCIMGMTTAFVIPTDRYIHYLGRWGRSKREVCIIANTCHDLLEELPSVSDIIPPKQEGVVRLAYLGYLANSSGCQWLLDFCRESKSGAELLIAGKCPPGKLKIKLQSTPNCTFLDRLTYEKALSLMRESDAVTLLYDPDLPKLSISSSTKFFEAMMVGTPVLISRGVSTAHLVEEKGLGFVVEYGSMEGLRGIVEWLRDRKKMTEMRTRCRQYYLDNLKLSKELVKYRDLYLRLVKTGQSS